jgi:serine/threonine protein kinase
MIVGGSTSITKPENVIVSLNGHASLLDFDTAQMMPGKPKKFPKITGTPAYMSPEQLQGKSHRLSRRYLRVGR